MQRFRPTRLALILIVTILILVILQMNHFTRTGERIISRSSAKEYVAKALDIEDEYTDDVAEYILDNKIDVQYIIEKSTDDIGNITIEICDTSQNKTLLTLDNKYNIISNH